MTKSLNVMVPLTNFSYKEAVETAKDEKKSLPKLLQDAIQSYLLERRIDKLQAFGRKQAKKLGIKPSMIEDIVDEFRQ